MVEKTYGQSKGITGIFRLGIKDKIGMKIKMIKAKLKPQYFRG